MVLSEVVGLEIWAVPEVGGDDAAGRYPAAVERLEHGHGGLSLHLVRGRVRVRVRVKVDW